MAMKMLFFLAAASAVGSLFGAVTMTKVGE